MWDFLECIDNWLHVKHLNHGTLGDSASPKFYSNRMPYSTKSPFLVSYICHQCTCGLEWVSSWTKSSTFTQTKTKDTLVSQIVSFRKSLQTIFISTFSVYPLGTLLHCQKNIIIPIGYSLIVPAEHYRTFRLYRHDIHT